MRRWEAAYPGAFVPVPGSPLTCFPPACVRGRNRRAIPPLEEVYPMNHRRQGFTLIELLVVIAVIAIIAAILFPVFAQAREKARSVRCLSNMRQIGTAVTMYLQDYDGQYPQEHPSCPDPAVGTSGT